MGIAGEHQPPIYYKVKKDIKPNKEIFDLYNKFFEFISDYLVVDTLGDGTIYYELDFSERKGKSISELEYQVKYFWDKQIGSLPKEEVLKTYSSTHELTNTYTWENLKTKLKMVCRFSNKNLKNSWTLNDVDKLGIKIWQKIK